MFVNFFISFLFISSLLLSYPPQAEFTNYSKFIGKYPGFIKSNYFEDDLYFYYLSKNNLNDKKIDNILSKIRLQSIANLTQSICCGFDVSLLDDIRKLKIIDTQNSSCKSSYDIDVNSTEINKIDLLFYNVVDNVSLYAMKVLKNDITQSNECDCRIKIN